MILALPQVGSCQVYFFVWITANNYDDHDCNKPSYEASLM